MGTSLQLVEHLTPGRDLDAYVQNVSTIPILTPEEERELAEVCILSKTLMRLASWLCHICALLCTSRAATRATACLWVI